MLKTKYASEIWWFCVVTIVLYLFISCNWFITFFPFVRLFSTIRQIRRQNYLFDRWYKNTTKYFEDTSEKKKDKMMLTTETTKKKLFVYKYIYETSFEKGIRIEKKIFITYTLTIHKVLFITTFPFIFTLHSWWQIVSALCS